MSKGEFLPFGDNIAQKVENVHHLAVHFHCVGGFADAMVALAVASSPEADLHMSSRRFVVNFEVLRSIAKLTNRVNLRVLFQILCGGFEGRVVLLIVVIQSGMWLSVQRQLNTS